MARSAARPRVKTTLKPVKLTEDPDGSVKAWYRIADLILDPDNAKSHNARNLDVIGESVSAFEQQSPIVIDADGIVRAGNGTCESLTQRGIELVWGVRSELRSQEAADYAKADNRTAELSNWNYPRLSNALRTLRDAGVKLDLLGWPDQDLAPLIQARWSPPPPLPNDMRESAPAGDDDEEEDGPDTLPEAVAPLVVTGDQWKTISGAIAALHVQMNRDVSEGEALRRICLDWIEQCP